MIRISERLEGRGSQFCSYVEHLKGSNTGRNRYRLTIRLGGYKDQSHGTVERWTGEKWEQIVYVGGHTLTVDCNAGYNKALSTTMFATDRDRLLTLANEVVND